MKPTVKQMLTKVIAWEAVLLAGCGLSLWSEGQVGMQNAGIFALLAFLSIIAAVGVGIWSVEQWHQLKDKRFHIMVRYPGTDPNAKDPYTLVTEVDDIWTAREEAEKLYALYPDAIIWDRENFSHVPIKVPIYSMCEPPSHIEAKRQD